MKDKIINFLTDIVKEMKKVSWPKKQELIDSVKIVVVTMIIFAAIVYAIDKGLEAVLKLIFSA
ncbi:MAG: preprotein translocase subunit SecE [Ignavibacteria bacterium]|nr:preprotein translocase subunit SecE [Ignavibacteria bacterium]